LQQLLSGSGRVLEKKNVLSSVFWIAIDNAHSAIRRRQLCSGARKVRSETLGMTTRHTNHQRDGNGAET
jgi:hypothetical protein